MTNQVRSSRPPTVSEPPLARSNASPDPASEQPTESSGARLRRKGHRGRLFLNAFGAAALLVYVVALAVSNTDRVRVDWVFGTSSPPLIWLVVLTALVGWVFGLLVATVLRRRTRAPKPSQAR